MFQGFHFPSFSQPPNTSLSLSSRTHGIHWSTHAHPDELVPGVRAPEALQPLQALNRPAKVAVHQGARQFDLCRHWKRLR